MSTDRSLIARHQLGITAPAAVSSVLPLRVTERTPAAAPPPPPDLTPLVQAVEGGLQGVRDELQPLLVEIEQECVELAVAAAEHITRRELERGQYDLAPALGEIVDRHRRQLTEEHAVLRLHPDDAARVREGLNPETAALLQIQDDPRVERASLTLEFGATRLLRSLTTELSQLRRALLGAEDDR